MNQGTHSEPIEQKTKSLGLLLLLLQIGCMVGYGVAGNYTSNSNGIIILQSEVIPIIFLFLFVLVGFGMLLNVYR